MSSCPCFGLCAMCTGVRPPCKARNASRKWVEGFKLPRQWGVPHKHLMKKTSAGKARCLKAHDALIALQTGMMAVLANYPGVSPEMDEKRKPYARFVGQLTTCIRALTARNIKPQAMQKLRVLVEKTWDTMERICSYDMLVINSHIFRHAVELVLRNGPMKEAWMYAFESAFGINKLVAKNPAFIVSSIVNSIERRIMMGKLKAFRQAYKNETYTKVKEQTLVPDPKIDPPEFFGTEKTMEELTDTEKEHLQNYLCANNPHYQRIWIKYTEYVAKHDR